ncbi:hypothetical protein BDW69DRAFT_179227 [Aspergillus filifer]
MASSPIWSPLESQFSIDWAKDAALQTLYAIVEGEFRLHENEGTKNIEVYTGDCVGAGVARVCPLFNSEALPCVRSFCTRLFDTDIEALRDTLPATALVLLAMFFLHINGNEKKITTKLMHGVSIWCQAQSSITQIVALQYKGSIQDTITELLQGRPKTTPREFFIAKGMQDYVSKKFTTLEALPDMVGKDKLVELLEDHVNSRMIEKNLGDLRSACRHIIHSRIGSTPASIPIKRSVGPWSTPARERIQRPSLCGIQ